MIAAWSVSVASAEESTWVQADLVVAVEDRDAAAERLVAWAGEHGGWFTEVTPSRVVLAVPVAQADALVAFASQQGLVVAREVSREDRREIIEDLRSRKGAREGMLARYFTLLSTAGPEAVVAVEQEIVRLVREIETLSGQLRVLEARVATATVRVSFTFRDRSSPVRGGASPFPWISTLDLAGLVEAFQWESTPSRPRRAVAAAAIPEGFSAYEKRRRGVVRAASSDGVVFRVRAVPHVPEATLAFWQEAVREHLIDAGYVLVEQAALSTPEGQGFRLELAAPYGPVDFGYHVAVVVEGGRLRVSEAAGEVTTLAAHEPAIVAAMQSNAR